MHERQFVAKKWQWVIAELDAVFQVEKFNAHGHDNFGRLQPFFPLVASDLWNLKNKSGQNWL